MYCYKPVGQNPQPFSNHNIAGDFFFFNNLSLSDDMPVAMVYE